MYNISMDRIRNIGVIGIIANQSNEKTNLIKDELIEKLSSKNISTLSFCDDIKDAKSLDSFCEKVDLIFAIGGDGTILSVLRSCGKNNIPLIGINAGRKGFLAEVSINEIDFAIDKIIANDYSVEERIMLEATIYDKDDIIIQDELIAVNDFNIARHGYARMIRLEVYIDDQLAESFDADGILIVSPIGSTAYSLSAGGPIVLPGINCMLITPVCSHSLHTRPIVAPENVEIKVVAKDLLQDVITTIDGQKMISIPMEGSIGITKSKYMARFVRFHNKDYYTRFLKKIIKWSIK